MLDISNITATVFLVGGICQHCVAGDGAAHESHQIESFVVKGHRVLIGANPDCSTRRILPAVAILQQWDVNG
ncbi:MAG: hypothetical protein AAFP90_11200, partial [Planctomycetota bacterium]